jgi:hypothetical protein
MHKSLVRLLVSSFIIQFKKNIHAPSLLYRNARDETSWLLKPFQKSDVSTGKPGEHETFLLHIHAGASALYRAGTVLVFSGARTDRDASMSEAESYRDVLLRTLGDTDIVQHAMSVGRILCEDASTDSYQNLLFSIIKYYEIQGEWPQMITVITHSFKEARFLVRSVCIDLGRGYANKCRSVTRMLFAGPAIEYACRASIRRSLWQSCAKCSD